MNKSPLIWCWWGWEPIVFYRYVKDRAVGIGDFQWHQLDDWYAALHSRAAVEAAARLGINHLITHFHKGFGIDYEHEQIDLTARLVKIAGEFGISVWGYTQWGTIFPEYFFQENPDAVNWLALNEDGTPCSWDGTNLRLMPCINSPEYLSYIKKCLRIGLEKVGLEGIHFDNFYARPCYCNRCRERFRNLYHHEIPPISQLEQPNCSNPAVHDWIQFRVDCVTQRMQELTEFIHSIHPQAGIIWNPSPIRGQLDMRAARGIDIHQVASHADYLWVENGNFPGIRKNHLYHQALFFKLLTSGGARCFSTSWKRSTEGLGLPETAEEVMISVAESVAFGGEAGSNWIARPQFFQQLMHGGTLEIQLQKAFDFVRQHTDLFQNSMNSGDVAVYFDNTEAGRNFSDYFGKILILTELLLRNHILFYITYTPVQSGKIKTIGVRPAEGVVAVDLPEGTITGDYACSVSLTKNHRTFAAPLNKLIGTNTVCIQAPETVFAELRKSSSGHRILHIIDYTGRCQDTIELKFQDSDITPEIHSPSNTAILTGTGNTRLLTGLQTWAVIEF